MTHNLVEIRPGRKINIIHLPNINTATLFFIHGLGGRAEQWKNQLEFFTSNYNVIAFDMLGHGYSEKPTPDKANSIYSFLELSADIQAIFEKYRTETNIVIGHSYGGAFASYLAWKNPEFIEKLVLLAAVPLTPKRDLPPIIKLPTFILEIIRPLFSKSFSKLAFAVTTDKAIIEKEIDWGRKNPMSIIKSLMLGLEKIPEVNPNEIKQQTLILTNESDGIVPANSTQNYYQHLPYIQSKMVTGAKHMLMLEQPAFINSAIDEFINTR